VLAYMFIELGEMSQVSRSAVTVLLSIIVHTYKASSSHRVLHLPPPAPPCRREGR
jgi:hypothetical protein